MLLGIKKKPKPPEKLSVRDFYNRKNKIVIVRESRGIGDILTARMLFSNFKRLMPEVEITFACDDYYFDLLANHPFLDKVVSFRDLNLNEYAASYDISTCCIRYESATMGKNTKHRAEIWADHCGVPLTDTTMYLPIISENMIAGGIDKIKQLRKEAYRRDNKDGPSVLFSPLAHEFHRSLTADQIKDTIRMLRRKGFFVFTTHQIETNLHNEIDIPLLVGNTFYEWMSYVHAADYVVSADTSTFHYAGGIKKPLTGIFTHVDGKLRGKFYDFILVQKHRDDGNWPCGPCYNYFYCTNESCKDPRSPTELRPCLTQLTKEEIESGVDKMLAKWTI